MTDDELRQMFADLRRHYDVTQESTRSDIRALAEGSGHLDANLDRTADRVEAKIESAAACA